MQTPMHEPGFARFASSETDIYQLSGAASKRGTVLQLHDRHCTWASADLQFRNLVHFITSLAWVSPEYQSVSPKYGSDISPERDIENSPRLLWSNIHKIILLELLELSSWFTCWNLMTMMWMCGRAWGSNLWFGVSLTAINAKKLNRNVETMVVLSLWMFCFALIPKILWLCLNKFVQICNF